MYDAPDADIIMDTTLRDGEQSPGIAFTAEEKAEYVRKAEKAGIRYIEIGFPASSLDKEACAAAAKAAKLARLVGLSITTRPSIDAVKSSGAHEIAFVVPCSRSHIEAVYGKDLKSLLESLNDSIQYADTVGLIPTVGFEDASHGDHDIIIEILRYISKLPVSTDCLRIGDTRGQLLPSEVGSLVEMFKANRPSENTRVAFHAHNDLGLATANAISALQSGANCVHATITGLGERAGNASLEQVACVLKFRLGYSIDLDMPELIELADYVMEIALIVPPKCAPIVGRNVFKHEAGLHQKGMLSDGNAYEFLPARLFGKESSLILGKHSGRNIRINIAKTAGLDEEVVYQLQRELAEGKLLLKDRFTKYREEFLKADFVGLDRIDAVQLLKDRSQKQK